MLPLISPPEKQKEEGPRDDVSSILGERNLEEVSSQELGGKLIYNQVYIETSLGSRQWYLHWWGQEMRKSPTFLLSVGTALDQDRQNRPSLHPNGTRKVWLQSIYPHCVTLGRSCQLSA